MALLSQIKFPVMTKTVLNGPEQAPLWKFLKDNHLNTDIDVPAWCSFPALICFLSVSEAV